jgi:hypothetical protein
MCMLNLHSRGMTCMSRGVVGCSMCIMHCQLVPGLTHWCVCLLLCRAHAASPVMALSIPTLPPTLLRAPSEQAEHIQAAHA